jgi:RimJ/RimL family protein N-acetyltransferase
MIPVLETERLRLREWRESDFEPYAAIYADEGQARFIGGVHSRDDAWRRMASFAGHWALRGYGLWALEEKATGGFAGWSGLWNPEGFPAPEIAWTLIPALRGRGLAQEAGLRVRDFAYQTLGWSSAISLIVIGNAPSVRVAEKLGAVYEQTVQFRGSECAIYRHPDAQSLPANSNRLH